MSKPLPELIASLQKNEAGQLLPESWQDIVDTYNQIDNQSLLVEAIACFMGFSKNQTKIVENAFTQSNLNYLNLESLKNRVLISIPALKALPVKDEEWETFSAYFEKKPFRFTLSTTLHLLSIVKKQDYAVLASQLVRTKQPERAAKVLKKASETTKPQIRSHKKRRFVSPDKNLIANSHDLTEEQRDKLKQNIRICPLTVTSPVANNPLRKAITPGGSEVNCIYENSSHIRIFRASTPVGNKENQGQIRVSKATPRRLFNTVECYEITLSYTITLEKFLERQGQKRPRGQNSVMGISCGKFFAGHGVKITVRKHGSDTHWTHIIAFCLGGDQDKTNLLPATAAANYNILELIERNIIQILKEKKTKQIIIHVTIIYDNKAIKIPSELVYVLQWQGEDNKSYEEKIRINPRSYKRNSPALLATIEYLRNEAEKPEASTSGIAI